MIYATLFLVVICLSGLAVYLYWRERQKQKVFDDTLLRLKTDFQKSEKVLHDQLEQSKSQVDVYKSRLVIDVMKAVNGERTRIGSNLHDYLGSMLWALKVQIGLMERKGNPSIDGLTAISNANQIIEEIILKNKDLIQDLVPKTLLTHGLSAAVREHCRRLSSDKMLFEFNEVEENRHYTINTQEALILFQIIQEIMNNCLKHSDSRNIFVLFNWGFNLIISIVNNGKAFELRSDQMNNSTGHGFLTILERISALRGSIESESGPPNQLILTIPLTR